MPLHVPLAVVRWTHEQEFGVEFIRMEPKDQQDLREVINRADAKIQSYEPPRRSTNKERKASGT